MEIKQEMYKLKMNVTAMPVKATQSVTQVQIKRKPNKGLYQSQTYLEISVTVHLSQAVKIN